MNQQRIHMTDPVRHPVLGRVAAVLWLAAAACIITCKGTAVQKPVDERVAVSVVDASRFPHALHTGDNQVIRGYQNRGLGCADCHPSQAVVKGEVARPGLRDHAPCDECHRDQFYREPGAFCAICHTTTKLTGDADIGMQPYPERGFQKVLGSRFSHRGHLDRQGMEKRVGFHIGCTDCHSREASSRDPMLPGHKQCARCHEQAEQARQAVSMAGCEGCHQQRDVALVRGRVLITGDLSFAHVDHERDMAGASVACATCHQDVSGSRTAADTSVPPMKSCATCHEDSEKTPVRARMARCEVCHTAIRAGEAPANHAPGGSPVELPEDHTLAFRRDHKAQAADANNKCSYCHSGLGRRSRDNCYQCHSIMRPRDHGLGWMDDSHGRAASVERDRCATCHTGDECVACHQVTPRSHTPLASFRRGGHSTAARLDTRSCFACHTFEDTCSNCHRGER